MVQKLSYILVSVCRLEWFWYLFSVLRKICYKLEKSINNQKIFFINSFAQKTQSKKFLDVTFGLKRIQHKRRNTYETMKPIFSPGHEV